jgi:peroxiredoxin
MTPAPLQHQIDEFNAQARNQLTADLLQDLTRPIAQRIQSGAAEQALTEGASVPDFTLPDAFGHPVTLSHLLQHGPVVLTFYRGAWCPHCRLTLHAYRQALPQIQASGASLVAISLQTPEHSRAMVEKEELTFAVLSYVDNTVARRFGLVYTIDEAVRAAHRQVGANLPAFNGDDSDSRELPMPGTVLLAFVDPDFTHRLDPSAIIARLLTRLATLTIEKTQLLTLTHQLHTVPRPGPVWRCARCSASCGTRRCSTRAWPVRWRSISRCSATKAGWRWIWRWPPTYS